MPLQFQLLTAISHVSSARCEDWEGLPVAPATIADGMLMTGNQNVNRGHNVIIAGWLLC